METLASCVLYNSHFHKEAFLNFPKLNPLLYSVLASCLSLSLQHLSQISFYIYVCGYLINVCLLCKFNEDRGHAVLFPFVTPAVDTMSETISIY